MLPSQARLEAGQSLPRRITDSSTTARAGTIQAYFNRASSTNSTELDMTQAPWTCSLQLRNPQALCYVNAGITAILHACSAAEIEVLEMESITKVLTLSSTRRQAVLLPQIHRFRALTPAWDFQSGQQDSAGYLHYLFQALHTLQITWDTRCQQDGELRIRTQGANPIPMSMLEVEASGANVQGVINHWHCADGVTALNHGYSLVCIQLNRYMNGDKCQKAIDFDQQVLLPVFAADSTVQWLCYNVSSAIIHLGRYTNSGHYKKHCFVSGPCGALRMITKLVCRFVYMLATERMCTCSCAACVLMSHVLRLPSCADEPWAQKPQRHSSPGHLHSHHDGRRVKTGELLL